MKRDNVEDYYSELKRNNSLGVFLHRLGNQVGRNVTNKDDITKMEATVKLLETSNPKLKVKLGDIDYRAIHDGQTALDEPEEIYSVGSPRCKCEYRCFCCEKLKTSFSIDARLSKQIST